MIAQTAHTARCPLSTFSSFVASIIAIAFSSFLRYSAEPGAGADAGADEGRVAGALEGAEVGAGQSVGPAEKPSLPALLVGLLVGLSGVFALDPEQLAQRCSFNPERKRGMAFCARSA